VHEHALGARAALAGRQVRAHDDLVDRLADRGVLEHDAHVLAAHLERDEQLGPIEPGLEDAAADRPAPREAQAADLGRRDHRRTDLAGADDDVEHARRQPGGERRLCIALTAQGRHVARLDHDGVARGERRDHVRVTEVEREVERPDDADDAERLVPQELAGGDLPGPYVCGHRRLHQLEAIEERLDLLLRLAPDLARLEHDRVRELVRARRDLLFEPIEVRPSLRRIERCPRGLSTRGRSRSLLHRTDRVTGLEHHRAIGGGVARDQRVA
jgi:hypothetical protein